MLFEGHRGASNGSTTISRQTLLGSNKSSLLPDHPKRNFCHRLDESTFMRSSKSRSRGNKNRSNNRPTGGNIINRVFDSSGPDGKVRGTPQQIIEKYNQLHRDAVLSGDRVDAENFAQHAEHYTRLLAEAQREVDAKREEQEEQNRQRQADRDRQQQQERERNAERQAERDREREARLKAQEEASNSGAAASVIDPGAGDQPDIGGPADLVETPEDTPPPKKRAPRTRKKAPKPDDAVASDGGGDQPDPAEAAE